MVSARRAASCALATLIIGGCSVNGTPGPAPKRTDAISLPAGLDTERLFDCAESSIASFARESSSWPGVSRRDAAAGVLESGEFEEENRGGFRIRLERTSPTAAKIEMKGAGAYFVDLGVDRAMTDFKASLATCLAGPSG